MGGLPAITLRVFHPGPAVALLTLEDQADRLMLLPHDTDDHGESASRKNTMESMGRRILWFSPAGTRKAYPVDKRSRTASPQSFEDARSENSAVNRRVQGRGEWRAKSLRALSSNRTFRRSGVAADWFHTKPTIHLAETVAALTTSDSASSMFRRFLKSRHRLVSADVRAHGAVPGRPFLTGVLVSPDLSLRLSASHRTMPNPNWPVLQLIHTCRDPV